MVRDKRHVFERCPLAIWIPSNITRSGATPFKDSDFLFLTISTPKFSSSLKKSWKPSWNAMK